MVAMTRVQRMLLWGGLITTGVGLLVLGIYFFHMGLEQSSQISGIIGAFTGILGIAISAWGVALARGAANPPSARPQGSNIRQSQQSGNNSTNIQSGGDLTIGDRNEIGKSK